MAEVAREHGCDPRSFKLRIGLFGGEPCSEAMRAEIESCWGLTATVNYGLTEVIGPGVAGECRELAGMHILEDLFYPEVIDPQSGKPLPDGERGELVLTPLAKEGFPVLRYRTGDITRIIPEPCPCGRTTRRLDYITGRNDDMIIIKGVNIFPSQVGEVLASFRELSPHYLLVLHRHKGFIRDLEVQVELSEAGFSDRFQELEALEERIRQRLRAALSLAPRVKLVEPKTLERTTGKTRRIVESEVADHEDRVVMTGNEAIARGAYEAGVRVGTAYPGTPGTEILENLARYPGVECNWSPNEKVALEVAAGASMEGARVLVAMQHVGVTVAADPLMTLSYTGVGGGLVLVSADDPGMHSSQNEQDNRHYARFAKIPLLEPADSQEAKDYVIAALGLSERFDTPVMLRTTTRISHSRSIVTPGERVELPSERV